MYRFFIKIQSFVLSLWQERWDKEVDNKLHAIMSQIDEIYYSGCTNRKDEVIINRLRIGHTRLTHSFRIENKPHPPPPPLSTPPPTPPFMWSVWRGSRINCETYFDWMQFPEDHSSTLCCDWFKSAALWNVWSKRILEFVKDIGLYNSLYLSCGFHWCLQWLIALWFWCFCVQTGGDGACHNAFSHIFSLSFDDAIVLVFKMLRLAF